MNSQAIFTIILLILTLAVLTSQRLRADLTAILVMLALIFSGTLTPEETFSAFGQPVIVIVASIFILGAALHETGVTVIIANQILRFSGRGEVVLMVAIMLIAATMSAVLNGLLVVAVLMPAVLSVARQAKMSPSRLLMPLAMTTTIGNQGTLIGSIVNLLGSDILVTNGYAPFHLFTLTPYAAASVAVTVLWFALIGRRFLRRDLPDEPDRPSMQEIQQSYRLDNLLYRVRVRSNSNLIATYVGESDLQPSFHLNVMTVRSHQGRPKAATPEWVLEQDDVLIVAGDYGHVLQAAAKYNLEVKGPVQLAEFNRLGLENLRLAEVIVPYRSALSGKSLTAIDFRERYRLNVLAVQRQGKAFRHDLPNFVLAAGDTLLVQGPLVRIHDLGRDLSLIPVTDLGPQPGDLVTGKAGLTLLILAIMLVVVVTNLLSLATATLTAVVTLILTSCISIERAYRSLNGSFLVLIGGMFPLAVALQQTGAAETIAQLIAGLNSSLGALGTLLLLYLFASVVTQVIANPVVTALLTPVAISLAVAQSLPPHIFVIAIIFASNAAYATPLTDGDNLLVREAGQYTMRDYLVQGIPLFILQTIILMSFFAVALW